MADDNQKQQEEPTAGGESRPEGRKVTEEPFDKTQGKPKETKAEKADVKVGKKLQDIISEIEKLSVLELSELVKALETKFGVTAQAPVAAVSAGTAPAGAEAGVSEQTTFNVILTDSGANKISVIKAVREIVQTLGLKETKDLVDSPPKPVLEGVNKENAEEAKKKLEAAGAKVELK